MANVRRFAISGFIARRKIEKTSPEISDPPVHGIDFTARAERGIPGCAQTHLHLPVISVRDSKIVNQERRNVHIRFKIFAIVSDAVYPAALGKSQRVRERNVIPVTAGEQGYSAIPQ